MEKMDKAIVERAIELRKDHCDGSKATLTPQEKALLPITNWSDEPLFNLIVNGMTDEERKDPTNAEFVRTLEPLKSLMDHRGITHQAFADVTGYTYPTVFPKESGWVGFSEDVFSAVLCAVALLYVAQDNEAGDPFSPSPEHYQEQTAAYEKSPVRSDGTRKMEEPQSSLFLRCLREVIRDFQNALLIFPPMDFSRIGTGTLDGFPLAPQIDTLTMIQNIAKANQFLTRRWAFGPDSPVTEEETATFERMELEGVVLELPSEDVHTLLQIAETMAMSRLLERRAKPGEHWREIRTEAKPEEYKDIAAGEHWTDEEQTPLRRFWRAVNSFTTATQPARRTMLLAEMRKCLHDRLEELTPNLRQGYFPAWVAFDEPEP